MNKTDKRRKEFFRVERKSDKHIELECDTYGEALGFCENENLTEDTHQILKFTKKNNDV